VVSVPPATTALKALPHSLKYPAARYLNYLIQREIDLLSSVTVLLYN
jgi:hypothetical protein